MGAFSTRKAYFYNLCKLNNLVMHDQPIAVGSDEKRVSFLSIEDDENLAAAAATVIHFPCVVLLDLKGKLNENNGSIRRQWNNTLWFLNKGAGDSESAYKKDAYDVSEAVMNQFISRIKEEYENDGNCGTFGVIDFNSFFFEMTGRVEDNLYGWRLYFADEQHAPDITTYDNTKWLNA